jgi:hypothetical protein
LADNSPEIIPNISTNANSAHPIMQLPIDPNIQQLQLPLTDSNNPILPNQINTNIITNHIPTNNFYVADNNNLKNNIAQPEFHVIN